MTTNKLKTAGLLFAAAILFSFFAPRLAKAQTGFDVLWKKDKLYEEHGIQLRLNKARFSPDGKYIYFVSVTAVKDSIGNFYYPSRVYKLSSETSEIISSSELSSNIGNREFRDFDLSGSGKKYVTVQIREGLKIWDAETYKLLSQVQPDKEHEFTKVAISPDEKYVAFLSSAMGDDHKHIDYILTIYDTEMKQIIKEMEWDKIHELRFSPDSRVLAIGSGSSKYSTRSLNLYDLATRSVTNVFINDGYVESPMYIEYSEDSKILVSSSNHKAYIYNLETQSMQKFGVYNDCCYPEQITILPGNNNYDVAYFAGIDQDMHRIIYNNGKEVKSYPFAYYYLATNSNEGKLKIFGYSGNAIAVLTPSPVSVIESPITNITIKHSEDYLTITSSGIESQTAKIIISDLSGKEVYAGSIELSSDNTQRINVPLGVGAYLYQVIGQSKTYSGKFVVGE